MKREDKIKKLNELGIYEKWYNNVNSGVATLLLNDGSGWFDFINHSFDWCLSTEGAEFWLEVSVK